VFSGLTIVGLACGTAAALRSPRAAHAGIRTLAACVAGNVALVACDTWFVEFQAQARWIALSMLPLTVVAVLAPTRGTLAYAVRVGWPAAFLAFLLVAAARSVLLIAANPCLP
jgi:hypothetical protein